MIKKDKEIKQEINTDNYLKKKKKKIKIKYGRNRYRNMSNEKKQKLEEYQKSYREAKKSQFSDQCNIFLII